MPAAIAIPVALTLASILANASSSGKQSKQKEKQEKLDKVTSRRSAIERALDSGFQTRPGRTLDPADISSQQILSGLGQLGAQIGFSPRGQKFLGGS